MKRLLFVLFATALILASCADNTPAKPSDVAAAAAVAPAAMMSSGATPAADLKTAVTAMAGLSADPVMADIMSQFTSAPVASVSPAKAALSKAVGTFLSLNAKSLSSNFSDQMTKVQTDIKNFPTSKSLSESITLSGESVGQYLKLTTATCDFSASMVTSDGAALNTSTMANFKSASGQATLKLVADSQNLPGASALKDLKVRVNAGGTESIGSKTVSGNVQPADLVIDYGESAVVAISVNSAGKGGKIVVKADVKNAATIPDPTTAFGGKDPDYSAFAPSISVSITVYSDSGATAYTNTWTDMAKLQADMTTAMAK